MISIALHIPPAAVFSHFSTQVNFKPISTLSAFAIAPTEQAQEHNYNAEHSNRCTMTSDNRTMATVKRTITSAEHTMVSGKFTITSVKYTMTSVKRTITSVERAMAFIKFTMTSIINTTSKYSFIFRSNINNRRLSTDNSLL